jgi:hypothetical protein
MIALLLPPFVAACRFQCFDESLSLSVQVRRLFIVCGCPAFRGISHSDGFVDFGSSGFDGFSYMFSRDGAAWGARRVCGHSLLQLREGGLKSRNLFFSIPNSRVRRAKPALKTSSARFDVPQTLTHYAKLALHLSELVTGQRLSAFSQQLGASLLHSPPSFTVRSKRIGVEVRAGQLSNGVA